MPRKKKPPWVHRKTDKDSEPKEFSKTPNIAIDNPKLFSLTEKAVFQIVVRKTTGYHVESAVLSVSEVARLTDLERGPVRKALNSLELKGWIICIGLGPRGAKIYKLALVESLDDLKPLKELPNKADLPTEQPDIKNSEGTNWSFSDQDGRNKGTNWSPNDQDEKGTNWSQENQVSGHEITTSYPLDHYIKETIKKTTTTSQSSLSKSKPKKLPQELIDELPEEHRKNSSVLNNLKAALNGTFEYTNKANNETTLIKSTTSTLLDAIKYTNSWDERGKIHTSYSGHLYKSIALSLKLEVIKTKTEPTGRKRNYAPTAPPPGSVDPYEAILKAKEAKTHE